MKEFDFELKEVMKGLSPKEVDSKLQPGLEECHNLEPTDGDYVLHELVTDLNSTGTIWE